MTEGLGLLEEFSPHSYEQWKAAAEALLKGAPFDKVMLTPTEEGITLQPLYRREDLAGLSHLADFPGAGSLVRGRKASGFRKNPWLVSQELPYSLPGELNRVLLSDLKRGQTEINLLLDVASQDGQDADLAASGEVGACGLSVSSGR